MKTKLFIAALCAVLVLGLTACGSSTAADTSAAGSSDPVGETTIEDSSDSGDDAVEVVAPKENSIWKYMDIECPDAADLSKIEYYCEDNLYVTLETADDMQYAINTMNEAGIAGEAEIKDESHHAAWTFKFYDKSGSEMFTVVYDSYFNLCVSENGYQGTDISNYKIFALEDEGDAIGSYANFLAMAYWNS